MYTHTHGTHVTRINKKLYEQIRRTTLFLGKQGFLQMRKGIDIYILYYYDFIIYKYIYIYIYYTYDTVYRLHSI